MSKDFASNLRFLRLQEKMTQPQLAEKLGVSKGMISFWENGVCEPTASNIVKIARLFSVTTDELLGVSET